MPTCSVSSWVDRGQHLDVHSGLHRQQPDPADRVRVGARDGDDHAVGAGRLHARGSSSIVPRTGTPRIRRCLLERVVVEDADRLPLALRVAQHRADQLAAGFAAADDQDLGPAPLAARLVAALAGPAPDRPSPGGQHQRAERGAGRHAARDPLEDHVEAVAPPAHAQHDGAEQHHLLEAGERRHGRGEAESPSHEREARDGADGEPVSDCAPRDVSDPTWSKRSHANTTKQTIQARASKAATSAAGTDEAPGTMLIIV